MEIKSGAAYTWNIASDKEGYIFASEHILPQIDIDRYGWNNNSMVISLENFKEQMDYLYKNNYHTATMEELERFINGTLDLPKNAIVITFDDGYLSNVIHAYPVMKQYYQKGAIFLGINTVLKKEDYLPSSLQFIHKDELFKYSDVFNYCSHTYKMHNMNNEKAYLEILSYDEIKNDLIISKELTGGDYISYPFGKYNETSLKVVKDLGFKLGFTVNYGHVYPNSPRLELPRIMVYNHTTMNKFIGDIQ